MESSSFCLLLLLLLQRRARGVVDPQVDLAADKLRAPPQRQSASLPHSDRDLMTVASSHSESLSAHSLPLWGFFYLISYSRSLICCIYYFLHCLLIRFLFRLIWATGCPRWKSSLHRPASRTRLTGRYLVVAGMHFIYGWCLCLPVLLFWLVNWLHKCTCSVNFLLHIQHLLLCILPKCTP